MFIKGIIVILVLFACGFIIFHEVSKVRAEIKKFHDDLGGHDNIE